MFITAAKPSMDVTIYIFMIKLAVQDNELWQEDSEGPKGSKVPGSQGHKVQGS